MLADASPFLNFGPSERTVLFGVKLDTWGEYIETILRVTPPILNVCTHDDGACISLPIVCDYRCLVGRSDLHLREHGRGRVCFRQVSSQPTIVKKDQALSFRSLVN